MKKIGLAVFTFLFVYGSVNAQTPSLWGSLQSGQNPVGFKVMEKYDHSRPHKLKYDYEGKLYEGERARPMQISIWYPAQKTVTSQLSFEDYLFLTAKEETFGQITEQDQTKAMERFAQAPWARGANADQLKAALKSKTLASRNADPAQGSFPLVIITNSTGISSPFGNALLAEFLASNGYIVASFPSMGALSRQLDSRESFVQVDDIQFVIDAVQDHPGLNRNKLALIGLGFGSLASSLTAMHNKDVDALVSLDGSVASIFGYSLLFQSSLYKPTRLTIPVLHVSTQKPGPVYDVTFFNAAKYSTVTYVRVKGMRGVDFSSLAMLSPMVSGFGGPPPQDDPAAKPQEGYSAVCHYVLNFLQANLKQDLQASTFLKNTPDQNGFRAGLVTTEMKQGLRRPPTEDEFVEIINTKGIPEAQKIYRQVVKDNTEYRIFDSETLNGLAGQWIDAQKREEAIALLQLNLEAYPDDWEVFDMLGKAYQESGKKQLAIEHYNKSLELNPDNQNAVEQLKKLQQS